MFFDSVRKGQVWKAVDDFKMTFFGFEGCVIPKSTRIVIVSVPIFLLQKFYDIMPLTLKGLDERLIPNIEKMKREKEGYGVPINKHSLKRWFVLDKDQEIKFDNPDAEKFWNFVNGKSGEFLREFRK